MRLQRFVPAAALLVLVSCNNSTSPYGGGGGGGGGHSTTITVGNNFFSPTPDTVPVGTRVTFSWAAGAVNHNVTWDTGPITLTNSLTMSSGTYQTDPLSAGKYTYHCSIHGSIGMIGTLVAK